RWSRSSRCARSLRTCAGSRSPSADTSFPRSSRRCSPITCCDFSRARISSREETAMTKVRRGLLGALLALFGGPAFAQETYPSKPVRLMVSLAAGGPTDQVARIMSAKLTELLGQTVVVENKTGAGGNIGAAEVAKAAPDGYLLLMATVSTHAINP